MLGGSFSEKNWNFSSLNNLSDLGKMGGIILPPRKFFGKLFPCAAKKSSGMWNPRCGYPPHKYIGEGVSVNLLTKPDMELFSNFETMEGGVSCDSEM